MSSNIDGSKFCGKCETQQPLENFYYYDYETSVDGIRPFCKTCEINRVKDYYVHRKEAILAQQRKAYADNKDGRRDKKLAQKRAYRQANPELFAAQKRAYRQRRKAKMEGLK